MDFLIFGLQRSGTNYLEVLLQKNFKEFKRNNRGSKAWKHRVKAKGLLHNINPVPAFIIRKNPYKWIESVAIRNNVDFIKTQTEFPICEKKGFPDDCYLGPKHMNIIQMAKTYELWYDQWVENTLEKIKDKSTSLRYEDLLDEKKRNLFLEKTQERFELKKLQNEWVNPPPGSVSQSKGMKTDMIKYYKEENNCGLNQKQISYINSVLTPEFFNKAGYARL